MLVNIFGREKGGLDYVLRDGTAEVLQGEPRLTQGLIKSISGRQPYTAGVISEKDMLAENVCRKAIHGLDYQLRAGLPIESLSTVYTRHTSKKRFEIHFNTANIEIITGRAYAPYLDAIDRRRFSAWQEFFNLKHQLPHPGDSLRIKPDYAGSRLPRTHQLLLTEIWDQCDRGVKSGLISSRLELAAYLEAKGYNIRVKTHTGKDLEQPVILLTDGSRLRLKGSIYYRKDFTPAMLNPENTKPTPAAVEARKDELKKIVTAGLDFRAYHTIGRLFGRANQPSGLKGNALEYLRDLMSQKMTMWSIGTPLLSSRTESRPEELTLVREFIGATAPSDDPCSSALDLAFDKEAITVRYNAENHSAAGFAAINSSSSRRKIDELPEPLLSLLPQEEITSSTDPELVAPDSYPEQTSGPSPSSPESEPSR